MEGRGSGSCLHDMTWPVMRPSMFVCLISKCAAQLAIPLLRSLSSCVRIVSLHAHPSPPSLSLLSASCKIATHGSDQPSIQHATDQTLSITKKITYGH